MKQVLRSSDLTGPGYLKRKKRGTLGKRTQNARKFIDRIDKIFQDKERNETDSFLTILLNPVNPV
jgi:hypothetical protein